MFLGIFWVYVTLDLTHTPAFRTKETPSQKKEKGKKKEEEKVKLSLDHNKPEQGARLTFEVGFKGGFFFVDVFLLQLGV